MGLKFHAKGMGLVSVPGELRQKGLRARYVGRESIWDANMKQMLHPASREPYECASPEEEARLVKLTVQDDALWPADEATAQACGKELQKLEWREGAWVAAQPSREPPGRSAKTKE